MKKLGILALFVFGFGQAQKLELGFKLGYVNSTLKFSEQGMSETFDAKSSVYISAPLEYHINPYLSLQGEFGMAGLGGENLIINGQNSRLHLTSLYFPLGVKFYPIKEKLSLLSGVNLGFTMKALGKQNGEDVEFSNFKKANHSYFLGAEYKITKVFFAEARYNIGLSNLVRESGQTMKNNFFQIGVGYNFASQ